MLQASRPLALVVDDDQDSTSLMAQALVAAGWQVHARTGEWAGPDALSYLLSADPMPSLVLLDQRMPHLPGTLLLARLQTLAVDMSATAVVIVTGAASELRPDWLEAEFGVAGVIDKPVSLRTIQRVAEPLRQYLAGHVLGVGQTDPEAQTFPREGVRL